MATYRYTNTQVEVTHSGRCRNCSISDQSESWFSSRFSSCRPTGREVLSGELQKENGANCVSNMYQNWLQSSLEEYPGAIITIESDVHFSYHKLVILFLQACNSSKFGTMFRMEHTCDEEKNTGASLYTSSPCQWTEALFQMTPLSSPPSSSHLAP